MEAIGFDKLISKHASTEDTLRLIVDTVNDYSKSGFVRDAVKKLCPPGTDRNTCIRNIFDYYCRNVDYLLDDKGVEKVYTPARTISEGAGDCKKAATLVASFLVAAGINPVLKHVFYQGNDDYTHIYVIVLNSDGTYITLDPTNNCKFNSEVSYSHGSLHFLDGKVMELRQMGNSGMGGKVIQNFDFADGLHDVMSEIESIGNSGVIPGTGGTVPHDIQRETFLKIVRMNQEDIASIIALALSSDPHALDSYWKSIGGDIAELKKAVIDGAKKKGGIGCPIGAAPAWAADYPQSITLLRDHDFIQAFIDRFMSDPAALDNLDHIKIGGATGVKADTKTAKQYVFKQVLAWHSQPNNGTYDQYNYPGIESHVNDSTTPGTDRAPSAGILQTVAKVLSPVVNLIPGIGPIASKGLDAFAGTVTHEAQQQGYTVNPGSSGSYNVTLPHVSAASFGSFGGFLFKTILLQAPLQGVFHITQSSSVLITSVAISAALIVWGFKKVNQWILLKH